MAWPTIITISLFVFGVITVAMAVIERHRHLGRLSAGWELAAWFLFSGTFASLTFEQWSAGKIAQSSISALISIGMLSVAVVGFRGRKRLIEESKKQ